MPDFVPESVREQRDESPGEAAVRLADWLAMIAWIFGVRFYPFERVSLAKALGPVIRRWPQIAEWKAPKK